MGAIYAMVGIGFSFIYRVTTVLNFAQGEFLMLGGMVAITMTSVCGSSLPIALMQYQKGVPLAIKGIAGAVIGGLGNIWGAVVGGLIMGLAEALSAGVIASYMTDVVVFTILILVLFIKPVGLLKAKL